MTRQPSYLTIDRLANLGSCSKRWISTNGIISNSTLNVNDLQKTTITAIDQNFASIEDLLDGKLICGAGGGGFIQAILKKGVSKDTVHQRLKSVFADSDIDVWDTQLV